jgi:pilus assembly protein Flp/PilA
MMHFLLTLQNLVSARVEDSKDRGATAVEYGLMVTLIAVAIIAAVFALGDKMVTIFNSAANAI